MGLELRKELDVSPCRFVKHLRKLPNDLKFKFQFTKNLAKVEG